MTLLLDTNIILYYLGGKLSHGLPSGQYFTSIITEIELFSYPKLNIHAENQIKNFLNELAIINIDPEIKNLTISLRHKFSIKLPDAVIAATAPTLEAELLSNDQQFQKIPKLRHKPLPLKKSI